MNLLTMEFKKKWFDFVSFLYLKSIVLDKPIQFQLLKLSFISTFFRSLSSFLVLTVRNTE